MHCHQTRWSYYHLNCHQFWQIPKKITLWGEIKSDKIVTWIFTKYGDHTITLIITNSGRSPRKSPYWVKKKVNKSSHWPSPNTGKFPQKSYYQSKPVISSLNFDRNCKKNHNCCLFVLQFHPARGKSLILVLLRSSILQSLQPRWPEQDKDEALPTGWMKLKIVARPAGWPTWRRSSPWPSWSTSCCSSSVSPSSLATISTRSPVSSDDEDEKEKNSQNVIWHRQPALTAKYGPDRLRSRPSPDNLWQIVTRIVTKYIVRFPDPLWEPDYQIQG